MLLKYSEIQFFIHLNCNNQTHYGGLLSVSVVLQNLKHPVPQLFFVQVKQFHFNAN